MTDDDAITIPAEPLDNAPGGYLGVEAWISLDEALRYALNPQY